MISGTNGNLQLANAPTLTSLWETGENNNKKEHPLFSFIRLHHLWESLLIASGIVGVVLSVTDVRTILKGWPIWGLAIAGPVFQLAMLSIFWVWGKKKGQP
jgi:hypothetical protein